jgi:F-type H+-transporting ATPase subunit epsilon
MAETFQFDLVSPERRLVSVVARRVEIPAMDGDLTALPDHAPFLTTLRPGIVRVTAESEVAEYVVTGGFAEISPTAASVLAEHAVPRAEASGILADLQAEAEQALADAPEDGRMAASQRVRDVAALKAQIG